LTCQSARNNWHDVLLEAEEFLGLWLQFVYDDEDFPVSKSAGVSFRKISKFASPFSLTMKLSTVLSLGLSFSALSTAHVIKRTFETVVDAGNSSANLMACAIGVHMIVARASTEPPGQGIIGVVATLVQGMILGLDLEVVDYPATLQNYNTSELAGTTAMTQLITEYVARCPNSKIALPGYSQVFVFHVLPRVYN
jgi:hypothetical protein